MHSTSTSMCACVNGFLVSLGVEPTRAKKKGGFGAHAPVGAAAFSLDHAARDRRLKKRGEYLGLAKPRPEGNRGPRGQGSGVRSRAMQGGGMLHVASHNSSTSNALMKVDLPALNSPATTTMSSSPIWEITIKPGARSEATPS